MERLMAIITAPASRHDETLYRSAAVAMALGGAMLTSGGAKAQILSTIDQPLPAYVYFNDTLQFTFGSDNTIVGTGNNLIASSNGTAISQSFGTSIDAAMFTGASGNVVDFTLKNTPGYVALDINVASGIDYYGWAELVNNNSSPGNFSGHTVYSSGNPTDLIAYNFQSIANTPINAGDASIPEPASLALLASGVAAVAAIRRRRPTASAAAPGHVS
jgi:hypothetical protein